MLFGPSFGNEKPEKELDPNLGRTLRAQQSWRSSVVAGVRMVMYERKSSMRDSRAFLRGANRRETAGKLEGSWRESGGGC